MKVKSLSCLWLFETPWTRLLCAWDFPGMNTGVGCHFFLHLMLNKLPKNYLHENDQETTQWISIHILGHSENLTWIIHSMVVCPPTGVKQRNHNPDPRSLKAPYTIQSQVSLWRTIFKTHKWFEIPSSRIMKNKLICN